MAYTIEELIVDDSFIAYCTQQSETDIAKWDDYLYHHPEELAVMEEARRLVLGLQYMLKKKQDELSANESLSGKYLSVADTDDERSYRAGSKSARKKIWPWVAAAAFALTTGTTFVLKTLQKQATPTPFFVHTKPAGFDKSVTSPKGQIKIIWLPDSTRVTLNAGSFLGMDEAFGVTNRTVYLDGEAFFEVAHDKHLPFIVDVSKYKVKAVGTKFNVKAYKSDFFSETALIEGKVQILIPGTTKDAVYKTLEINQKFVLKDSADNAAIQFPKETVVAPLVQTDLPTHAETAWMDHYLIFEEQTLEEIKNTIERKYNVSVTIADPEVRRYKYTANFRNETVEEVLKALQISYPFSYTKDGDNIIIKK
ncbi:FecR family protein [Niabella aquatica]